MKVTLKIINTFIILRYIIFTEPITLSHKACKFGYSFTDSETDLLTSESRTSEEESQEAIKTIRRRPRINIDPRRKKQNNPGVSVTKIHKT